MLKFILRAVCALLILAAAAMIAINARAETFYVACSTTSTVNVRARASEESPIVKILDRGFSFEYAQEVTDNFQYIPIETWDGFGGYVRFDLLSVTPPVLIKDAPETVIAGKGRVRLRKMPGGDLAGWVRPGDTAVILAAMPCGAREIWRRVLMTSGKQRGKYGWIREDMLEGIDKARDGG